MRLTTEADLEKMASWLAEVYGSRLQCLVAYGSVAGGNHRHRHSDINLLAVLDAIDAATLDQGAPAVRWWTKRGNPPPVLLSRPEQDCAADVFPIEYLDIQANHRLLRGQDLFSQVPNFPALHRQQVEHDLRAKLLRLRAAYMDRGRDAKRLEALLHESASTFLTLFRHALVAVGEPLRLPKDEVLAAASARFGFSPEPLAAVLDARRHSTRIAGGKLEPVRAVFAAYLAAIQRVERTLEEYHAPQSQPAP